ncbi:uncharacterized protein I303_102037 [Kwoniella dejecticola CBS 10117]|uniref:RRM domain-containing protein n=1 Tax=Kwoniella dejecticola CBS 10117 TaxID=1296121 RepID=A0A1A6AC20_9TREE|nr:uncharacterized protein I303_01824 [Kwoniella dejecticola CBS 10117]OBR87616.1 hypothetical protein I303_01824 [Kwoniella dejecticola CBS 10117]
MATKPISRSLSPSSPPFIFPRSPPSRSGSTSTETLSSTFVNTSFTSSLDSHTETFKAVGAERDKPKTSVFPSKSNHAATTAKTFGAGWKSSSIFHPITSHPTTGAANQAFLPLLDTKGPFGNTYYIRPRSPSLPNLPSHIMTPTEHVPQHTQGPVLYPINTHNLPNDFELHTPCSPSSGDSHFSPYPNPPNDETPHIHPMRHQPSMASIDIELQDHSNSDQGRDVYTSISPINHHSSVPDLPYVQSHPHRQANVQYLEVQDEDAPIQFDQADQAGMKRGLRRMPAFNFGQMGARSKLMSTKSMPVIPMMGEGRNVFIHRVNAELSEEGLRAYASDFGDVVSVKIPARTPKPHAFVMFKKPDQAQNFIVHLKMRHIDCEFGKEDYQVQNKALEDPNSANLYIAGLPTNLTLDELSEMLAPGKICSWKPLVDEAGNRRGPIMARLQTRVQAIDVINKINGKYYQGMSERIQARIADSDEQKHFKRHQSISRDRPIPADRWAHSAFATEGTHDIELLHTREYLASQLEAINNQLSRTQIRSPKIVHTPNDYGTDIIGPSPVPIGQIPPGWATGHRHTSSNFSVDSLGSWPDWTGTWTQQAQSPNTIASAHQFQPRQQSLSFSDHDHPSLKGPTPPYSTLHLVKSSPELGTRGDTAAKLLWDRDNA